MTDNRSDDILIGKFFAENKVEIADNGFSRRVMNNIPARANRLNSLWRIFCIVIGVVFFISNRGWDVMAGCFKGIMADVITQNMFTMNPVAIIISLLVLVTVAGYNFVVAER